MIDAYQKSRDRLAGMDSVLQNKPDIKNKTPFVVQIQRLILWLQPQKKRKNLRPCSYALTVGDKVRHRIGAYIGEYIGKTCPNMPEHTHKETHGNTPAHTPIHKAPAHARQTMQKAHNHWIRTRQANNTQGTHTHTNTQQAHTKPTQAHHKA
jgi:hypothetical protein